MNLLPIILAASVTSLILGGCSNNGSTTNDPLLDDGPQLRVIDNSDEFYAALREGLVRTANDTIYGRYLEGDVAVNESLAVDGTGTTGGAGDTGGGQTAPTQNSDSNGTSVASDNITGTNVQEVGVDEQDRIKADNTYLYVLENDNRYYGIDGFGGATTGAADGVDMFVDEPLVSNPLNTLRILSFQPDAPDATPVADVEFDLQGRQAQGMYLHPASNGQNVIVTSSGFANYWAHWDQPYAFQSQKSGITRIDVSNPNNAQVADQFVMDGQIISSRRIGSNLIVASRHYPTIRGIEPYSVSEEEYKQAVDSTDLSTLLPNYTNQANNEATSLVDPASCFVAPNEGTDAYYVPNIVTLSVIDLNSMKLADSKCFLGSSETLYASPNAIYLATTRWNYSGGRGGLVVEDGTSIPIDYVDPRVNTDIHAFAINSNELNYQGSGSVKGHLGWSQLRKPFRMSEQNGFLRVATYSDRFDANISPINLTILKPNGRGALDTVSELPNDKRPAHIGKPGEQLYASRYVGDKAYIVTFRQTDPLYVVDLANPDDPYLAGELQIDGYSDYLQPISEDYLLGIGKDAVPANDGWGDGRGAVTQGIKLALFDVSDASVPTEVQSLIIGQRGSHTGALSDHRAITVQRATDQHPTRVAFGIDVNGQALPTTRPTIDNAWNYYKFNYSGLHGFEVRTGADAGITVIGTLVPTDGNVQYGSSYDDRSVIFNDSVYYIRGSKVYAAPWNQMENFVGPR